jgi:hypothetical protein
LNPLPVAAKFAAVDLTSGPFQRFTALLHVALPLLPRAVQTSNKKSVFIRVHPWLKIRANECNSCLAPVGLVS